MLNFFYYLPVEELKRKVLIELGVLQNSCLSGLPFMSAWSSIVKKKFIRA